MGSGTKLIGTLTVGVIGAGEGPVAISDFGFGGCAREVEEGVQSVWWGGWGVGRCGRRR